ncbi:hypothetical protein REPUB_Repub13aG0064600 [Reevesia pubescens]
MEEELDQGPWSVMGCTLNLKSCLVDQAVNEIDFSSVLFWIQVHNLPLEMLTHQNAIKIGEVFGSVMKVKDPSWRNGKGRSFLKIRVAIDVQRPLVTGKRNYGFVNDLSHSGDKREGFDFVDIQGDGVSLDNSFGCEVGLMKDKVVCSSGSGREEVLKKTGDSGMSRGHDSVSNFGGLCMDRNNVVQTVECVVLENESNRNLDLSGGLTDDDSMSDKKCEFYLRVSPVLDSGWCNVCIDKVLARKEEEKNSKKDIIHENSSQNIKEEGEGVNCVNHDDGYEGLKNDANENKLVVVFRNLDLKRGNLGFIEDFDIVRSKKVKMLNGSCEFSENKENVNVNNLEQCIAMEHGVSKQNIRKNTNRDLLRRRKRLNR